MNPIEQRAELLGNYVVEKLKERHFEAYYCARADEVEKLVDTLIPDGSSVGWGGSSTIRDMGLTAHLHTRNLTVIDRDLGKTADEKFDMHRKCLLADYFLTSANAVSDDGILVNIDGNGNRVAAISFGPKNVIVVVGINKIAPSIDAAVERARNTAATANSMRFIGSTPCAKTGKCFNCKSPESICSEVLITRLSKPANRIKVIIVGEELGF